MMSSSQNIRVDHVSLDKLNIDQVCNILNKGLKNYFEFATVSVVECPDLTKEPFNLAGSGLGGRSVIADVGGPPYLVPLVQRDKIYSFEQVAKIVTNQSEAFMIGASAGPFDVVGRNCELMPNVLLKKNDNSEYEVVRNNTYYAKLDDKNDYSLLKSTWSHFGLLGNLFVSEGKPGKVLKIEAHKRIDKNNFVSILRKILHDHYADQSVSLGGVFLIKTGKAKLHIMPDFSKTPLQSDEDVNNWLQFFEMDSPLVCLSVMHSHDPNLDLRVEHTHCFSDHNQGGHYHYDTTPQDVSYVGYFNLAEEIYRIDAPVVTHKIGRD